MTASGSVWIFCPWRSVAHYGVTNLCWVGPFIPALFYIFSWRNFLINCCFLWCCTFVLQVIGSQLSTHFDIIFNRLNVSAVVMLWDICLRRTFGPVLKQSRHCLGALWPRAEPKHDPYQSPNTHVWNKYNHFVFVECPTIQILLFCSQA